MGSNVKDYKDIFGNWRKSRQVDGQSCYTVSGLRWKHMRFRCRIGGSFQLTRPTYVGCNMSELFSDFHSFTEWCTMQLGYGLDGYAIDKDILVKGNKVYSEDTCALVPQALNNFLTTRAALRGKCVIGVCRLSSQKGFRAKVNLGQGQVHLGSFGTQAEAYAAYRAAKEAEAYRWYERLKAGEFIVDERVIERMRTWTLEGEL